MFRLWCWANRQSRMRDNSNVYIRKDLQRFEQTTPLLLLAACNFEANEYFQINVPRGLILLTRNSPLSFTANVPPLGTFFKVYSGNAFFMEYNNSFPWFSPLFPLRSIKEKRKIRRAWKFHRVNFPLEHCRDFSFFFLDILNLTIFAGKCTRLIAPWLPFFSLVFGIADWRRDDRTYEQFRHVTSRVTSMFYYLISLNSSRLRHPPLGIPRAN